MPQLFRAAQLRTQPPNWTWSVDTIHVCAAQLVWDTMRVSTAFQPHIQGTQMNRV